jgi:hypothetical protein
MTVTWHTQARKCPGPVASRPGAKTSTKLWKRMC